MRCMPNSELPRARDRMAPQKRSGRPAGAQLLRTALAVEALTVGSAAY